MSDKYKNLVLKKVYFDEGFNGSMQHIVLNIFEKLPNHIDRVYNPELFKSHILANIEQCSKYNGLLVRIFEYEKGATGLINLENSNTSADIEELLPPEKRQFLENEVILYIHNNHVMACGLGNKDSLVQNIFGTLAVKSGAIESSFKMKISDVPNKTELKKAKEIGIKRIELSVSGYLANIENFHEKSPKDKIIERIFSTVDESAAVKKRANTYGKLVLRRSKFKTEEIKKDEWLTSVGEAIIESDTDDYTIILEDNTKISTTKLKVIKSVRLKKFANSISYFEAKEALTQFYDELKKNGSLEW
jgi:hypothetical protein